MSVFNSCRISIVEENHLWKDCSCSMKTDMEILFERSMKDALRIDETGRCEVKLPWKVDPSTLSNNRTQAINRSIALETKISKEPDVLRLFNKQIEEMISLGVLKNVDSSYPKRYLLLLAVINLE